MKAMLDKPRFRRGDQVVAAGLAGEVVDPDAGTTGGDRVYGQPQRLVSVRWSGEATPVEVRESLLTKRGAKR
ncbi:hypothetical protein [Micromonospora marina]|uniref:hypothetical protein n=1 Tax=Micromonospora marina TaxID=307120 RepID=UPI003D733FE7